MRSQLNHGDALNYMNKKMGEIRNACRHINTEGSKIEKKISQVSKKIERTPEGKMSSQSYIAPTTSVKTTPVFITARFRAGSTFLWNYFSDLPGITSFYEPLQENLPQHLIRQTPTQESHIGVHSYWDEYENISIDIKRLHSEEFGFRKLFLEEDDTYDELKCYISFLIHSTPGMIPVLQFNRVDFRLPWLRKNYPDAKIIHLYRCPRDQWYSMVKGHLNMSVTDANLNTNYDLLLWSVYLAQYFPFLTDSIESSYERHYYIWRLSKLMGERCADTSISFDDEILKSPELALQKIQSVIDINGHEDKFLSSIARVQKNLWQSVRPVSWFEEIEKCCDKKLNELGLLNFFASKPLKEIMADFSDVWKRIHSESPHELLKKTIILLLQARGETAVSIGRIGDDLDKIVATSNEVAENSQKIVDKYLKETVKQ